MDNVFDFEGIEIDQDLLFKTSKKYCGWLRQASDTYDSTIKIKHVTIKRNMVNIMLFLMSNAYTFQLKPWGF